MDDHPLFGSLMKLSSGFSRPLLDLAREMEEGMLSKRSRWASWWL